MSGYYTLEKQDAVAFMENTMEDTSVDLIVTDPPYESLEKHRSKGTTTRLKQSKSSSNQWFDIFPNKRFPDFFSEAYRVLKSGTHLYMFCDQETMFHVVPIAQEAGFRFWKPLVWDKMVLGMGYHYRARYEFVLFFEKGKRKLNDLSIPDVLQSRRLKGAYPTQKPLPICEVLVKQSSSPGDLVFDPFMGAGTTGVAALKLDRRFLGCDTSPEAIHTASHRLQEAAQVYLS